MEIDFRWLQIHASDAHNHPTAIRWGDTSYYNVLQVRHSEGPRGETWWGDWHDIPVLAMPENRG